MFEGRHIDHTPNRLHWLERLVRLFKAPSNSSFPEKPVSPICETVVTEDPMSEEFCTHTRFQLWLARARQRMSGRVHAAAAGNGVCPICGLQRAETADLESVLTVWFHDGVIMEYCFKSHDPEDCYRIAESALHINLKDSVLSYSIELISAVHFRKRRIPPVAPEVLAAEQIIAGMHRQD